MLPSYRLGSSYLSLSNVQNDCPFLTPSECPPLWTTLVER